MRIHLESLGWDNLEFVRTLRNQLRENFFDTKPITKPQQEEWYLDYLDGHNLLFWIIWFNDKPVGTISRTLITSIHFTITQDTVVFEIGNLMLLPAYQGKGIMLEAMCQVTSMASQCFYIAHVKPHNTASLNLFKRAGFWRVLRAR